MSETAMAMLAEYSYKRGRQDERAEIAGLLTPGTIEITIRARDENNEMDAIRQVLSFEEFRASRGKAYRLLMEETYAKFAAGSSIIKKLLGVL